MIRYSGLSMAEQSDSAEDAWELADFLLEDLGADELVEQIFMHMNVDDAELLMQKILMTFGMKEPRTWLGKGEV